MASRSKQRKLAAIATAPKSPAQRVADVTYRELYNAITTLGQLHKKQHAELELLAENLAEVSLRVRYIMQHFKFEKGSRIVDANGQSVVGEIATLFDLYNLQREAFLASLSRELDDAQTLHPNGGAESSGSGAAAGIDSGADVVPVAADVSTTPEPAPAIRLAHSSR